ncbi:MAG: hypothetical protein Q8K85_24665, partial [Hyphomicrobium sp.]|nr:hypothetical protein [Hyphomicrobium sp.]
MRTRLIVRDLRHLGAQQHRHRADDVVRVLVLDHAFDRALVRVVRKAVAERYADAAHAGFEQRLDAEQDVLRLRIFRQADHRIG